LRSTIKFGIRSEDKVVPLVRGKKSPGKKRPRNKNSVKKSPGKKNPRTKVGEKQKKKYFKFKLSKIHV
jgi:hypothetical protein